MIWLRNGGWTTFKRNRNNIIEGLDPLRTSGMDRMRNGGQDIFFNLDHYLFRNFKNQFIGFGVDRRFNKRRVYRKGLNRTWRKIEGQTRINIV